MPKLDRDGVGIHYEVHGSGPVLLLTHFVWGRDPMVKLERSADLARAAHAWRSYNGNVGAHGLAQLCRELEDAARAGNFASARQIYTQIQALHAQVRDELQIEMRRSA